MSSSNRRHSTLADQGDAAPAVPEWMLTFGDMMSLLLTFFIMLVSMSELKSQEKFQAMADSMRQQFGFDMTSMSFGPGWAKPRNPKLAKIVAQARLRKLDMVDDTKKPGLVGEFDAARIVRAGGKTAVGNSIFFAASTYELTDPMRQDLQVIALDIVGKLHKIEIRGHADANATAGGGDFADSWGLAYSRCVKTMQFLVNELKIDSQRFVISVAGPNEPHQVSPDSRKVLQNDRVDIYLLDEVARSSSTAVDAESPRPAESESQ